MIASFVKKHLQLGAFVDIIMTNGLLEVCSHV
jgi:hypothetical protein